MDAKGLESVVIFVLGYFGRVLQDLFRDMRSREQRRKDFQRETLLVHQEILFEYTTAVGEVHNRRVAASQRTGEWDTQQVFDEEIRNKVVLKLIKLIVRVADDELRRLILEAQQSIDRILVADSRDAATRAMHESLQPIEKANTRLGEVLRGLY
jgi:hypothetical protein